MSESPVSTCPFDDVEKMLALIPKPKTWRSRLFGHEWIRVFIIGDRLIAFRESYN